MEVIDSIENTAFTFGDSVWYKDHSGTDAEIEKLLLFPYPDIRVD